MAKHFKNVKSLDDLKNQFKKLARENHPDAGGNAETMKEINCEYDALFPIWKDRHNADQPQNQTTETAESTRRHFYTQYGWEGSRYDSRLTLKEIAVIVRTYVKEKYPTYKFSVRTSYASMCQELHVSLKEAPADIYNRIPENWTKEQRHEIKRRMEHNYIMPELTSWTDSELTSWLNEGLEKIRNKGWNLDNYYIKNEAVQAMLDDVDSFVESYNYDDSDGMIDYFDVNFYYFNCSIDSNLKIVPRTARIKNKASKPAKTKSSTSAEEKANEQAQDVPQAVEQKTGYTYKITKGEDTRDGSELWLVRITETLDKAAYIEENKRIQALKGYYSKFRKTFIFRYDPTEALKAV